MPISWYPRNFTNPDLNFFDQNMHISDDAVYGVQLGLYVIGYKESKDDQVKTFSLKTFVFVFVTPTVITLIAASFAKAKSMSEKDISRECPNNDGGINGRVTRRKQVV